MKLVIIFQDQDQIERNVKDLSRQNVMGLNYFCQVAHVNIVQNTQNQVQMDSIVIETSANSMRS